MKTSVSKENLPVHIVIDYADTRLSNFGIEYLHENEKIREHNSPVHMGPRSNILSKTMVENLVKLSL